MQHLGVRFRHEAFGGVEFGEELWIGIDFADVPVHFNVVREYYETGQKSER